MFRRRSLLRVLIEESIVMVALLVLFLWCMGALGCASTLSVQQAGDGCTVTGEINTGTDVACTREGVIVRRNSAATVTNGIVETFFRSLLGGIP